MSIYKNFLLFFLSAPTALQSNHYRNAISLVGSNINMMNSTASVGQRNSLFMKSFGEKAEEGDRCSYIMNRELLLAIIQCQQDTPIISVQLKNISWFDAFIMRLTEFVNTLKAIPIDVLRVSTFADNHWCLRGPTPRTTFVGEPWFSNAPFLSLGKSLKYVFNAKQDPSFIYLLYGFISQAHLYDSDYQIDWNKSALGGMIEPKSAEYCVYQISSITIDDSIIAMHDQVLIDKIHRIVFAPCFNSLSTFGLKNFYAGIDVDIVQALGPTTKLDYVLIEDLSSHYNRSFQLLIRQIRVPSPIAAPVFLDANSKILPAKFQLFDEDTSSIEYSKILQKLESSMKFGEPILIGKQKFGLPIKLLEHQITIEPRIGNGHALNLIKFTPSNVWDALERLTQPNWEKIKNFFTKNDLVDYALKYLKGWTRLTVSGMISRIALFLTYQNLFPACFITLHSNGDPFISIEVNNIAFTTEVADFKLSTRTLSENVENKRPAKKSEEPKETKAAMHGLELKFLRQLPQFTIMPHNLSTYFIFGGGEQEFDLSTDIKPELAKAFGIVPMYTEQRYVDVRMAGAQCDLIEFHYDRGGYKSQWVGKLKAGVSESSSPAYGGRGWAHRNLFGYLTSDFVLEGIHSIIRLSLLGGYSGSDNKSTHVLKDTPEDALGNQHSQPSAETILSIYSPQPPKLRYEFVSQLKVITSPLHFAKIEAAYHQPANLYNNIGAGYYFQCKYSPMPSQADEILSLTKKEGAYSLQNLKTGALEAEASSSKIGPQYSVFNFCSNFEEGEGQNPYKPSFKAETPLYTIFQKMYNMPIYTSRLRWFMERWLPFQLSINKIVPAIRAEYMDFRDLGQEEAIYDSAYTIGITIDLHGSIYDRIFTQSILEHVTHLYCGYTFAYKHKRPTIDGLIYGFSDRKPVNIIWQALNTIFVIIQYFAGYEEKGQKQTKAK
jgi:hypothetical protein